MAYYGFRRDPDFLCQSACRGTLADAMNVTRCNQDEPYTLPYTIPEMVVIAMLAGTLSLVTVLGNSMVMISFKIDRQLQTISNYFLFSLAVADLAIGLISMPLFTVSTLLGYWPLGRHICDTWLALDYLASNASVLNLLIISFDRYFSVTRPLTYRAKRTTGKAAIMIAGAWGISLLLWPPWIYAWPYIEGKRTVPENECYIQFIETNHYITFGTAIAAFYIPVSVMIVLYYRIWRETKKRQKDLPNLQAGAKESSRRSNSSEECELALEDIRRYRSESGITDFFPHRRRPRVFTWAWFRNWCVKWWHSGREDDTDDYEETPSEFGYGTPLSLDTPLQSNVSRTTSFVRDPYGPSTSRDFVHHPQIHWPKHTQTPIATPRTTPRTTPRSTPRTTPTQTPPHSTFMIDDETTPPPRPKITPRSTGSEVYASIPDEGIYTIVIQLPKIPAEGEEPDPNDKPSIKLLHNEIPDSVKKAYGMGPKPKPKPAEPAPRPAEPVPGPSEKRDVSTSTFEDLNSIVPASSPAETLARRPSTMIPYKLPKTITRGRLLKRKKKTQEKKQDKKAAKTLTAILLSFIITWTPYNVLVLLKPVTSGYTCIPQQLWDFFYYLCYINSTINPVCYALCNASFRRTYVRILTCKWSSRDRVGVQRGGFNN